MKERKVKGFTLIELIICIAIIALILAVAIPKYNKARLSAVVAAHNSNVNNLKSAAILADIEKKDLSNDSVLIEYIEGGEIPEVPREISGSNSTKYSVSMDSNKNIIVKPGLVRLNGDKIEFVDGN